MQREVKNDLTKIVAVYYKLIATFILLCFTLSFSLAASTEEEMTRLFGDSRPYIEFFHKFREAVISDDREFVAAHIRYPIKISLDKKRIDIKNKSDFLANYSSIINNKVITAVEQQRLSNIFLNAKGVMFGNGQVWYSGICIDKECDSVLVKVIAINP